MCLRKSVFDVRYVASPLLDGINTPDPKGMLDEIGQGRDKILPTFDGCVGSCF